MKRIQLCCILFLVTFCFCQEEEEEDNGVNPFDAITKEYENYEAAKKKGRSGSDLPSEIVQGDMLLDDRDKVALGMLLPGKGRTQAKWFLGWIRKLWPTRIIPYTINHPGNRRANRQKTKDVILASFRDIEKVTCLKFRPKKYSDNNWLHYKPGVGCYSGIGRKYYKKAATEIILGQLCIVKSIVIHETLHALGFFHEQSRRDRDNYVKIFLYNVRPAMRSNFDKWDKLESDTHGTKYDYNSIMHYSQTSFTLNGERTMEAKNDPHLKLGNSKLSPIDIEEIRRRYHCHEGPSAVWSEWSGWSHCGRTWTKECLRSKHRICLTENLARCSGADKYGVQEKVEDCASQSLCDVEPRDGFWSQWARWTGPCSRSCGMGTRTRSRSCNSPSPKGGGKNCPGSKLETITCPNKKCSRAWDTNFSSGWGSWKQDKTDDRDWQIKRGASSNRRTGPKEDHTDGKGSYALLSAASPYQLRNKKARLMRSVNVVGQKCFSFAYMLNGKNIGSLSIYIKRSSNTYGNLWAKFGHQGDDWKTASFQLPKGRYQIFIEAKIGYSPASDIAIDDIYIDNGICVPEKCIDSNKGCNGWMKSGECTKNSKWMSTYCCKSCLNYKGEERKATSCKNNRPGCAGWATSGECKKNKVWMLQNCCLACKTATSCKNNRPRCAGWAASGECKKNKVWMLQNCCLACKTATCENNSAYASKCRGWATKGQCTKNEVWMRKNCCKACKSV